MNLRFLIIFFVLSSISIYAYCQSHHIKRRNFKGYIFIDSFDIFVTVDNQKSRYTPTISDIERVEILLKRELPELNKNKVKVNQYKCPVIHENMKKYTRQYFGFIDSSNNHIVLINFVWTNLIKTEKQLISDKLISPLGGCSYFWNVWVNITTGQVFNLSVNGSS